METIGKKMLLLHDVYFMGNGTYEGIIKNEPKCSIHCSDTIKRDLMTSKNLSQMDIGIFGFEGYFSHRVNAIRAASNQIGKQINLILGFGSKWQELIGEYCIVDFDRKQIISSTTSYVSSGNQFFKSDLIAFSVEDNSWRCYKPYYQYDMELAKIQSEGIIRGAEKYLGIQVNSKIDSKGRIWLCNYPSPIEIAELYMSAPHKYHEIMSLFSSKLRDMLLFINEHQNMEHQDEFIKHFYEHYSISLLCTQPAQTYANTLNANDNNLLESTMNEINTTFSKLNMYTFDFNKDEIDSIIDFLHNLTQNEEKQSKVSEDNQTAIVKELYKSSVVLSELRRFVINYAVSNNSYFSSIVTHRKVGIFEKRPEERWK